MPFCPVCRSAGKTEEEYSSHYVRASREPDAEVTCPLLLSRACHTCGEKGHTPKYCPKEQAYRQATTIPKHIGVPVYTRNKGKKVLVDFMEPEPVTKPVVKSGAGGEGKAVRLFIDDEEVAAAAPKEELTLAVEKKRMIAASKPQDEQSVVNQFACLADESDSEDDMCYTRTPEKKSWAAAAAPGAPKKVPGPPPLQRQQAYGAPKKLDFPPMPIRGMVRHKASTGVWTKGLMAAVEEKHGSIGAWCAAPEKGFDEVLLARKQAMAAEMEAMKRERDALAAQLKEMRESYADKVEMEQAAAAEAEEPPADFESAAPESLKIFLKKYEGKSWADMMDEEDGLKWGDMVDSDDDSW